MPDHNDLTEILARAQEIDQDSSHILKTRPDLAEIVTAAAETGLPREAVLAALRERLAEQALEHEPGEPVFAESPDGHWYAASFNGQSGNRISLRYYNGGIGTVEPSQIRPFNLAPGVKIQAYSASYKQWTDAEIVRFNPDSRSITVTYWWTEEVLPLERVRLKKEFKGFQTLHLLQGKTRAVATLAAVALASAAASGLLGFIIGRITSR